MTSYTATYSPDDNKLRLYASSRLDKETYDRVKAAGFGWAPRQELFVAPTWSPEREDLLLELAGEIDDEDKSLVERAEERADRFDDYSESRKADAEAARKAVAAIADGIPLGQPILVGHHSEKHARKDAERIDSGMRRAVKMWNTSKYWTERAAGALHAAKYKERPDVRARRIKTIEADRRKTEKTKAECELWLGRWTDLESLDNDREAQLVRARAFANHCRLTVTEPEGDRTYGWSAWDVLRPDEERYQACPAMTVAEVIAVARVKYARHIERCDRWLAHYANRLAYERAMLDEQGGATTDRWTFEVGGEVLVGKYWGIITKLNHGEGGGLVSLTTTHRYGRIQGVEAVTDYRPATKELTAAVKAANAKAPIANYPGEGFLKITQEEWKKCPTDYRGLTAVKGTDSIGAHRVRQMQAVFIKPRDRLPGYVEAKDETARYNVLHHYYFVFITDAKTVQPPGPDVTGAPPAKLPPPEAILQVTWTPAPPKAADPLAADMEAMRDALKVGIKVVSVPQLFPTPPVLAARMVEMADIQPEHRVLEPSAGMGNLLRSLPPCAELVAVEINHSLVRALAPLTDTMPCTVALFDRDFLECKPDTLYGKFDRIVMNPPFKDGADIRHIAHALTFLADGGRLVAICANGPRQQDALRPLAATWEELPEGTFAEQGTNVRTVLLTIEGPPVWSDRSEPAMTQDEQEADLAMARRFAGAAGLTVDRSRHETTTLTALWFYRDGKQIGSASRNRDMEWKTNRMERGSPTSERTFPKLVGAIHHVNMETTNV